MKLAECFNLSSQQKGFTLIELLVVITIIAILAGLAFPALTGAMRAAKRGQARTDCTNLVIAVKNYYNEYGKYPVTSAGADITWGPDNTDNNELMTVLMAESPTLNRKNITFIEPPLAEAEGRHGVLDGGGTNIGDFYDPWGTPYFIRVDSDYDSEIESPKDSSQVLFMGVAAWSAGMDNDDSTTQDNVYSFE